MLLSIPQDGNNFWGQLHQHFSAAVQGAGVLLADLLWSGLCIVLIFAAARLLLNLISRGTSRVMASQRYHKSDTQGKRTDTVMTLIRSILRYTIYGIALIRSLSVLGIGDTVNKLIVTAGIGSVAIGFGAQSLVKDVVTGLFLMFENQFSVGDYIKVDEQEGYVEATAMRVTYLRTFGGEQIIIPNGSINRVINYTRGSSMAIATVTVPYSTDCDQVIEAATTAAQRYYEQNPENFLAPPECRNITAFGEYGYQVTIAAKVRPLTHWGCERGFRREFLHEFAARGIPLAVRGFPPAVYPPEPPPEKPAE